MARMFFKFIWRGLYTVFLFSLLLSDSFSAASPFHKRRRLSSWSDPNATHHIQLENSVALIQDTLFQNKALMGQMGLEKRKYYVTTDEQEKCLRRLFYFIGAAGLMYRGESNQYYQSWPFPVATALTQGQRVYIDLRGMPSSEFIDWLTGANPNLLFKRSFSSHGVRKEGSIYNERKIKSPLRRIKRRERIYGMNFPLGGVGNELPNGNLIGPYGREFSTKKNRLYKNKQIGHLHIYSHDFPEDRVSVILVGIESCAPHSSNQFGCNHNMFSGVRNQRLNRSSSGGLKWSQITSLDQPPPAEYKGKVIEITADYAKYIIGKAEALLQLPEERQKATFSGFLRLNGEQAKRYLLRRNVWVQR